MRIAVTGGTGKAGRWTVDLLRETGHDVLNVDMRHDGSEHGLCLVADLTDPGQCHCDQDGPCKQRRCPGVDEGSVGPRTPSDHRGAHSANDVRHSDHRDKQGALLAAVQMETAILNVLLFLIIAVAGFGIARLLSYQVAAQVEAGNLRILMSQYEPPQHPVHILHREGRHASARVRTFIDLLAERLRGNRALNAQT